MLPVKEIDKTLSPSSSSSPSRATVITIINIRVATRPAPCIVDQTLEDVVVAHLASLMKSCLSFLVRVVDGNLITGNVMLYRPQSMILIKIRLSTDLFLMIYIHTLSVARISASFSKSSFITPMLPACQSRVDQEQGTKCLQ